VGPEGCRFGEIAGSRADRLKAITPNSGSEVADGELPPLHARARLFGYLLLVLAVLTLAVPAVACGLSAGAFVLDPASDDTVAPGAPGPLRSVRVKRGRSPDEDGIVSSDSDGEILLQIVAAVDDRSPAVATGHVQEGVGYRIRLVAGTLPDGLTLDEQASRAFDFAHDGTAFLRLSWIDGRTDEQEPFAATLGVSAAA
jgi:hypothetical protein